MKCPACPDIALTMSDRQGVEIDYCPQCRGVWLDRGELDKLIERAVAMQAAPTRNAPAQAQPQFEDSDYNRGSHRGNQPGYGTGHGSQGKRHKSWLSEIFD